MLGSPAEAKNYQCSMYVKGKDGGKISYSGEANAIDNCIECKEKGKMFTMKPELVKDFVDDKLDMKMHVKIRCLKDEAKDDDKESGVSEGED